jgi:NitT/TauT family transport system substrate-binding protein
MVHSLRVRAFAAALALLLPAGAVHATEKFRFANGGFGLWAVEGTRLGQKAGIFAKYGLDVESYGTAGAGETLQAVISGSADMSVGVGTAGVLGAFAKGAPIRIFGSNFTGAGDIFYYVRADSPLHALADTTPANTIGYSSAGSSSNMTALALIAEAGVKARPIATGSQPNTLTQVMSGQVDVGFATPPFGLKEVDEGKIRIIGTGNDAPSLRNQSVRVDIVNLRVMTERHDAFLKFVRAYREVLDWMKQDPEAVRMWSQETGVPIARARRAAYDYQPRSSQEHLKINGIDALMAAAVKQKFLTRPLTREQLAELIQIPPM